MIATFFTFSSFAVGQGIVRPARCEGKTIYTVREHEESAKSMKNLPGAILACCAATAWGADGQARTNWFHDPFFKLTDGVAACPEPLGPLVTEEQALRDSHHRNERGLRCYLEHRCIHPSSYDYDKDIAARIQAAGAHIAPLPSTLWVLVQGRRVWVYGCVGPGYRAGTLEKALRKIEDVELAMEELRVGPHGNVTYRTK
jgi:hypothetical protein